MLNREKILHKTQTEKKKIEIYKHKAYTHKNRNGGQKNKRKKFKWIHLTNAEKINCKIKKKNRFNKKIFSLKLQQITQKTVFKWTWSIRLVRVLSNFKTKALQNEHLEYAFRLNAKRTFNAMRCDAIFFHIPNQLPSDNTCW